MKIGIIGSTGLVGSHLKRLLAAEHELYTPHHVALDITDTADVRAWCRSVQPDLVINCSAIDVDRCEREPQLAEAVNVTGPQALAHIAREHGASILHFSTNYVFDGKQHGHIYTQADATDAINVYGRTKRVGEEALLTANPQSYVIRTSWVFGTGKENFLSTVHRKLRAGERIRSIKDVWASATYVNDLAARTLEVLARRSYGLYHVVNAGVLNYLEFAEEAARLAHADTALIEQVSESDAQRLAERPRFTPMSCSLSAELGLPPLRDWRAALTAYIAEANPH
ncbi:MAG: dTDP-4-dehydrorhamnose reductase [Acidobacteria bacterium]|nr:dTDP-4-dehydrorhamnose reductase [Acidobacteriota bacterium]